MTLGLGLTLLLLALAWTAKKYIRRPRLRVAVVGAALLAAIPCAGFGAVRTYANLRPPPDPIAPREIARGIVYERRVDPAVPRVAHWVTVDLTTPGLEIVVPDATAED